VDLTRETFYKLFLDRLKNTMATTSGKVAEKPVKYECKYQKKRYIV